MLLNVELGGVYVSLFLYQPVPALIVLEVVTVLTCKEEKIESI